MLEVMCSMARLGSVGMGPRAVEDQLYFSPERFADV
jgi:hypothetical protein